MLFSVYIKKPSTMRCLALAERYIWFQQVKLFRKIILTLYIYFRKGNLRKEAQKWQKQNQV